MPSQLPVTKAMEHFRDHGFAGTSAEMLVERLGINRYSLYAEFGSKQALFEAALQRYDEEVIGQTFGPLETAEASVKEVRSLLEHFGSASAGPASGRGCLLCNTAVEFGLNDLTSIGFVQRYFARLSQAFFLALNNARNRGELRRAVEPRKEASFFTALILGILVMLRAGTPQAIIEDAALVAIQHLTSLSA